MSNSNRIEQVHRKLATRVCKLLEMPLKYDVLSEYKDWKKVGIERSIQFTLVSSDNSKLFDRAKRDLGGTCPVLPIKVISEDEIGNPAGWISWNEKWIRKIPCGKEKDRFELSTAGWTFFWGIWQRDKNQIFRAE